MTDRFLSAKEFAAILDLHESKIRQKIRLGEITAVNVSTPTKGAKTRNPHWRIPVSELDRFVRKNSTTAA